MKKKIVAVTLFVLSFATVCFAMGAPGGESRPNAAGGSILGSMGPALMIFLIIFLLPIVKSYLATKEAVKFKALVFVTTFFEWVGWIICITIIGLPIGLAFVLAAQSARVLIEIEKNTAETRNLVKQSLKTDS